MLRLAAIDKLSLYFFGERFSHFPLTGINQSQRRKMKIKNISSVAVLAIVGLAFAAGGTVLQANLIGVGKGKVTWKVKDAGNEHQASFNRRVE